MRKEIVFAVGRSILTHRSIAPFSERFSMFSRNVPHYFHTLPRASATIPCQLRSIYPNFLIKYSIKPSFVNYIPIRSQRTLRIWQRYVSNQKDAMAEEMKKLTILQRFRFLWRRYWYVLVPVHFGTYGIWFGLFYTISASGFDCLPLLEKLIEFLGLSQKVLDIVRNSSPVWRHAAVAYVMCKVISLLRYAVTIGVTHFAIKILARRGLIKPVPSKEKWVEIYKESHVRMEKMRDRYEDRWRKLAQKKPKS